MDILKIILYAMVSFITQFVTPPLPLPPTDEVSYLECCTTNCRYSSCTDRMGRCLEGELVQDVSLSHGDVVLKCCAVLGVLTPLGIVTIEKACNVYHEYHFKM